MYQEFPGTYQIYTVCPYKLAGTLVHWYGTSAVPSAAPKKRVLPKPEICISLQGQMETQPKKLSCVLATSLFNDLYTRSIREPSTRDSASAMSVYACQLRQFGKNRRTSNRHRLFRCIKKRKRVTLHLCATISLLVFMHHRMPSRESSRLSEVEVEADSSQEVCIFGNAQSAASAFRIYEMWDSLFPVFYYVYSSNDRTPSHLHQNIFLVTDDLESPFTRGAETALKEARRTYECEYFFLHDDDLYFNLNRHKSASTQLSSELLRVLRTYKPLQASFEWPNIKNFPVHAKVAAEFVGRDVMPAVVSDSGMTIYHESIVDFYFPMHPNHEGGFVGNWTLPTHFINAFSPCFFGIRINTLKYTNHRNVDKSLEQYNNKASWKVVNGIARHPAISHPYEFPQNAAYLRFLESASRTIPSCLFECFMNDTVAPRPNVIGKNMWLQKLLNMFDVRHQTLSSNKLLNRPDIHATLMEMIRTSPFRVRFTLLAFKRPAFVRDTVLKLLEQLYRERDLLASERIEVEIILRVDFSNGEIIKEFSDMEKTLSSLSRKRGVKFDCIISRKHLGLKTAWLTSWKPVTQDEYNVVLEDDILISSELVVSVIRLIRSLFYSHEYPYDTLFSVSLYNEFNSDVVDTPEIAELMTSASLRATPCSWGAIFSPVAWTAFIQWYDERDRTEPLMKDALSNRWPSGKSWKKYALRFMSERSLYTYFPHFPGNSTLTKRANLGQGTNDKSLDQVHQFKLLSSDDGAIRHPNIVKRYSYRLEADAPVDYDSFDGCTVVLRTFDDSSFPTKPLEHFSRLQTPDLKLQIIFIISRCRTCPRTEFKTRHSHAEKLDLTYLSADVEKPYSYVHYVKYDCVVMLEETTLAPTSNIRQSIDVWRQHFFHTVVAWYDHETRPSPEAEPCSDCELQYILSSNYAFIRNFLHVLNSEQFRKHISAVSSEPVCEDFLLSLLLV